MKKLVAMVVCGFCLTALIFAAPAAEKLVRDSEFSYIIGELFASEGEGIFELFEDADLELNYAALARGIRETVAGNPRYRPEELESKLTELVGSPFSDLYGYDDGTAEYEWDEYEMEDYYTPDFSDIEGINWQLSTITTSASGIEFDRSKLVTAGKGDIFTLQFANGQISGKGSPNRYNAPYTTEAGTQDLKISPLRSTLMADLNASTLVSESDYFALLNKVTRWEINSTFLVLSAGTESLYFVTVPDFSQVEGRNWKLVQIQKNNGAEFIFFDRALLEDRGNGDIFTLTLNAGQCSGKASPNRYTGPYTAGTSQKLSFGLAAATQMINLNAPTRLTESEYFSLLNAVEYWDISFGRLELHTQDAILFFE